MEPDIKPEIIYEVQINKILRHDSICIFHIEVKVI